MNYDVLQILMNVEKCRTHVHSSVSTALVHTCANVLKATSKPLTTERARNETVGLVLRAVCHSVFCGRL